MAWDVEFTPEAEREFARLDRSIQRRIRGFLIDRVAASGDPRVFGKALRGELRGLWRYRVGDYRILCRIEETRLLVLVVRVGHRKEIYE